MIENTESRDVFFSTLNSIQNKETTFFCSLKRGTLKI